MVTKQGRPCRQDGGRPSCSASCARSRSPSTWLRSSDGRTRLTSCVHTLQRPRPWRTRRAGASQLRWGCLTPAKPAQFLQLSSLLQVGIKAEESWGWSVYNTFEFDLLRATPWQESLVFAHTGHVPSPLTLPHAPANQTGEDGTWMGFAEHSCECTGSCNLFAAALTVCKT